MQDVEPKCLAKVPPAQVVHDCAPLELYDPAWQGEHAVGVSAPAAPLNVPAAQGEHDGAIEVALNEPGGQREQLREVKLAKLPAAQEKG